MGTTATFVALHTDRAAPQGLDLVLRAADISGWDIYTPRDRHAHPAAVERATVELVRIADGLGVVGFVEDRDWSYVAGVTPDGVMARVVFHAGGAEDYAEGQQVLSLVSAGPGDDTERFVTFASLLGRALTAERIRQIDEADTPFADDCLFAAFEELGIRVPDDIY